MQPLVAATAKYRPDIDGLRAVAVLAVVLYHAFPTSLRGGFVGVDVFFVISGFLISSIIFEDLARDAFTIRDFYIRRVRRILPALTVVLMAVLAFGYVVLVEDEYVQLGKHVFSAALFVSNITLYGESGYFDLAADTKPLLHLWSLGVEEQFYLLWPLLVALFWRRRWSLLGLVLLLGVASFSANIVLTQVDTAAAFFFPISRFWELMAGCAVAYIMRQRELGGHVHLRAASGLAMIGGAAIYFNAKMVFPGWAALVPVMGTVLVISAGPQAFTNRYLLSLRPMVWVGLISYPLYLWHWPLLSYAHILEDSTPLGKTRLYLLAVALLLAWLTYVAIERPIRFGAVRHKERLLIGGLVGLGVAGLIAFNAPRALYRDTFAPKVANGGDIGHEEFYGHIREKYFPCEPRELHSTTGKWRDVIRCFQSKNGKPTVAILGDSHAEHLFIGAAEANPAENVVYYLRSAPPTLDNPRAKDVFQYVLSQPSIHTVMLAVWWRGDKLFYDAPRLKDAVDALRASGKDVYLVEDVPRFPFYPQRCKYSGAAFREANRCDGTSEETLTNQSHYAHAQRVVAAATGAKMIPVLDLFCGASTCSMAPDAQLLFRDRHHLNVNGSRLVGTRLAVQARERPL